METARKAAEVFQGPLHFRFAMNELWARTNDETTVAIAAKLHQSSPVQAVPNPGRSSGTCAPPVSLQTAGVYHACKDPFTGLNEICSSEMVWLGMATYTQRPDIRLYHCRWT